MPFMNVFKKCVPLLSTSFPYLYLAVLQLRTLPPAKWSVPTPMVTPIMMSTDTRRLGVALAYAIYSPTYSATSSYIHRTIRDDHTFLWAGATMWLVCLFLPLSCSSSSDMIILPQLAELSNLYTHLTLRALRPPGTRVRAIPYGYGFSLVSCPNYFFEMLAWLVVVVLTGSWVGE